MSISGFLYCFAIKEKEIIFNKILYTISIYVIVIKTLQLISAYMFGNIADIWQVHRLEANAVNSIHGIIGSFGCNLTRCGTTIWGLKPY